MSLRILLADESSTIKKAFQLALSDLGAEIKNVPSGLDVLNVALEFQPHLVFADVLLTKKSGYEVCKELTQNPQTKHIPVVLMWSNFMEFNMTQASEAGYSDKLEKPFDSESLRSIVKKYHTESNHHPLAQMIEVPVLKEVLPEIEEEFRPVQLKNSHLNENPPPLNNPIHIETESYGDFEEVVLVKNNLKQDDLTEQVQLKIQNYLEKSPVGINKKSTNQYEENLVREEVRAMTEKICWQIIPELAEKIIREEIEKLMKNIEKSI